MNPIGDFINGSKSLTRNPLGIIALFVSLIYGFACLVLSSSISNLNTPEERIPLIWFIICFPLIILAAFIFLVVKHHEKLYSPSDFRGDDSFIQTIDRVQLRDKQLREVKILESAPVELNSELSAEGENVIDKKIEPTSQIEVAPIQEVIDQPQEFTENELVKFYSNAEMWAIQELRLKYKVLFRNNIKVDTGNGSQIELDAYGKDNSKTYVAEIKYWQIKKSNKQLKLAIQEFLAKSLRIKAALTKTRELKLIIVLVFDNLKVVDKEDLQDFITSINSEANVEFYDYQELKKSYE
jgi:hypothetical protein